MYEVVMLVVIAANVIMICRFAKMLERIDARLDMFGVEQSGEFECRDCFECTPDTREANRCDGGSKDELEEKVVLNEIGWRKNFETGRIEVKTSYGWVTVNQAEMDEAVKDDSECDGGSKDEELF